MQVKHDRALDIALGTSRKTKTWKNRTMLWSALLDRLATTTRTPETVAEYRAMGRDRQADIKDVGGFVGGYCEGGRRADVRARSVLCLDADYADGDLWGDWCLLYGNAAAVYSTHKHTPDKPRLRLVVPLARDVGPDEYQAIGRRIAEGLGIDKFDDTSYQPQRLMYWPSTSQDGAWVFDHVDGPLLDPDTVLATYRDWRDISSWPMSSRTADLVRRTERKQKDPLEKSGLVGAFCRAYQPIQEAIEAWVPTYQPCDEPGRYTYTEGSTAAGVVVYEDKYTFSHHATDPASGQLCNAWDLVRLHRFHELDEDCAPDTAANARPSYQAMAQLASGDGRVKAQLVADRAAEVAADFDALPDEDWTKRLRFTAKGALAQTIENVAVVLEHDPKLAGRLAYDEMERSIVTREDLPWRQVDGPSQWVDADDAQLRLYLERAYGLSGKDRIFDAVNVVAQDHAFHPVRQYLDGCVWDGTPRVETLLVDYLGAEDSTYVRAVTRKTLAAAVARIYRPGCKFDYMLTLQGRQGLGKSALIAKLGGAWYSDSFTTTSGKEAYEQTLGVWILEVGELAGLRKAEVEPVKLFISKTSDRFRPAYGRRIQDFPRQCIFIGTTNETQFLRDTTGNRRFWVVATPNEPTHDLWAELEPETVRRIWGEAVALWRAGEPLYLSKELEAVAAEQQSAFTEEDARTGEVQAYLDRLLPEDWDRKSKDERRAWLADDFVAAEGTVRRDRVCVAEVWQECFGRDLSTMKRTDVLEIRAILRRLPGWREVPEKKWVGPYGAQRVFARPWDPNWQESLAVNLADALADGKQVSGGGG